MKKIILFATVAWFCSISLFAQNGSPVSSYTYNTPYETVKVKPVKNGKVKNVIFMVGDGMGLVQVSAAWVANRGKLNLDNCTYTGFSRTYCANKLITDSGAGGTAFATGHKTNYHCVGVDPEGKPLTSLTELAHSKGLKTGVVVTCNLPDATPSDYCAHNADRDQEEAIAADYLNCNVDYIFGAGREKFNKRTDNRDLLAEMKQKGYQVCTSWDETKKLPKAKCSQYLLKASSNSHATVATFTAMPVCTPSVCSTRATKAFLPCLKAHVLMIAAILTIFRI